MSVSPGVTALQVGAAGVALAVALAAARHREKPAGLPVVTIAAAASVWASVIAVEPYVADRTVSMALQMTQYLMGDVVAVSWLYTAVEYAGRTWFQQRRVVAVTVGAVVASLLASVTNPIHGLVLTPATTVTASGIIDPVRGPFGFARLAWDYAIILVGVGILAVEVRNRQGTYGLQATVVLAAGTIPTIASAIEVFELVGVPGFSPSAVGIAISGVLLLWALFYADFLEVAPIARRTLIENMDDAVVALDTEGRVVDANQRTHAIFDIDGDPIGQQAGKVFAAYPELVKKFDASVSTEDELSMQQDGQTRYYDLSISPVYSESAVTLTTRSAGQLLGRLVVLRDVTERRRREEDLTLLKQVLARTLRHNIRNDLTAVKGFTEVLDDRTDGDHDDLTGKVLATTDDIVDASEKARSIEEIVDAPRERQAIDLPGAVDNCLRHLGERYPDATVHVDMPLEATVLGHQQLSLAIENVLENALEHAGDGPVTVSVTGERTGDQFRLSVTDDGPGIPAHEVQVLEQGAETDLEHGSGLGLWIVQLVVDRSGGTVSFEETQDGSRVTFTLDAA